MSRPRMPDLKPRTVSANRYLRSAWFRLHLKIF